MWPAHFSHLYGRTAVRQAWLGVCVGGIARFTKPHGFEIVRATLTKHVGGAFGCESVIFLIDGWWEENM